MLATKTSSFGSGSTTRLSVLSQRLPSTIGLSATRRLLPRRSSTVIPPLSAPRLSTTVRLQMRSGWFSLASLAIRRTPLHSRSRATSSYSVGNVVLASRSRVMLLRLLSSRLTGARSRPRFSPSPFARQLERRYAHNAEHGPNRVTDTSLTASYR